MNNNDFNDVNQDNDSNELNSELIDNDSNELNNELIDNDSNELNNELFDGDSNEILAKRSSNNVKKFLIIASILLIIIMGIIITKIFTNKTKEIVNDKFETLSETTNNMEENNVNEEKVVNNIEEGYYIRDYNYLNIYNLTDSNFNFKLFNYRLTLFDNCNGYIENDNITYTCHYESDSFSGNIVYENDVLTLNISDLSGDIIKDLFGSNTTSIEFDKYLDDNEFNDYINNLEVSDTPNNVDEN